MVLAFHLLQRFVKTLLVAANGHYTSTHLTAVDGALTAYATARTSNQYGFAS